MMDDCHFLWTRTCTVAICNETPVAICNNCPLHFLSSYDILHPWRPNGSHSVREKRREESFQARAEEFLGSDSQQAISKRKRECWLLIGHKKCFVLLCPITVKFAKISLWKMFSPYEIPSRRKVLYHWARVWLISIFCSINLKEEDMSNFRNLTCCMTSSPSIMGYHSCFWEHINVNQVS